MKKLLNGRRMLGISSIIGLYFLALFLIYQFKANHFLIGFFTELLTIPFLLAQIIFLILGIKLLFSKDEEGKLVITSVLILLISTILTLGSFIW